MGSCREKATQSHPFPASSIHEFSPIHGFTHQPIHLFILQFAHQAVTHPPIRAAATVHPLIIAILAPMNSFINPWVYPSIIHSFIHASFLPPIHPPIRPSVHPPMLPSFHPSSTHFIHLFLPSSHPYHLEKLRNS